MNAPASPIAADTRERFLAAIAQVVPAARIAEIHFFPPIRQGPIETGVAVVGAEPESASPGEDVAAGKAEAEVEVAAEAEVEVEGASEAEVAVEGESEAEVEAEGEEGAAGGSESEAEIAAEGEVAAEAAEGAAAADAEAPPAPAAPARATRHIVFMARYRLTRKGPDRGKWESEIIAEADAPLVTVEAVAEGVRKRSHDESAAERIDGNEARAILAAAEARRCQTTP